MAICCQNLAWFHTKFEIFCNFLVTYAQLSEIKLKAVPDRQKDKTEGQGKKRRKEKYTGENEIFSNLHDTDFLFFLYCCYLL